MIIRHLKDIGRQDFSPVAGKWIWAGARDTRRGYVPDICTFDTEWTTVSYTDEDGNEHGKGLLYLWTACIFGVVYEGRTLDEFVKLCRNLTAALRLNRKRILVFYVHNLSADFQFIQPYFTWDSIFAMDKRVILKAESAGLEFRCSYKMSNMSLEKFLQSEGVQHQKQSGKKFNYDKIRTPDTYLTAFERYYAACDVLGLYEAIKSKMEKDGDDVVSIPMTSTGYVRRDCREACQADPKYRLKYKDQILTAKQYNILRDAFRGGNTHANRMWAGQRLENVWSYDISSSYPAVMLYEQYPRGKFVKWSVRNEQDLLNLEKRGYGYVARIRLFNMRTENPVPYMSVSKRIPDMCQIDFDEDTKAYVHDNGRCLFEAGWTEMALTNVDWEIMRSHYQYDDFECVECYKVLMGPLPLPIRETISKYFVAKTDLKGVDGQEYFYTKSKNKLNGIYGMMVMALIKDGWLVDDGKWEVTPAEITNETLEKKYKSRNSFLHYQWGVWVTAYARKRLQKAIDICGTYLVYCDTDSVKFIYHPEIVRKLETQNAKIQSEADACETTATAFTRDGELQTLGLWDKDGVYKEFITLGAKKYAFVKTVNMEEPENGLFEWEDIFKFTVSGLGKDAKKELQSMEDFVLGKVIHCSGRTISEYDDDVEEHKIFVDGRNWPVRSNMAILDTTYTLGVSDDYYDLIDIFKETYVKTVIDGKKTYKFRSSNSYDPD